MKVDWLRFWMQETLNIGLEAKCTRLEEALVAAKSTGPEASTKGACQQMQERSDPTLNTWTAFRDEVQHVAAENVLLHCFPSFLPLPFCSRSLFAVPGPPLDAIALMRVRVV